MRIRLDLDAPDGERFGASSSVLSALQSARQLTMASAERRPFHSTNLL